MTSSICWTSKNKENLYKNVQKKYFANSTKIDPDNDPAESQIGDGSDDSAASQDLYKMYNFSDYDDPESDYDDNSDNADPNIKAKIHSDGSDASDVDNSVKPDDNIIVTSSIVDEGGVLEFYIYNNENDDLFCFREIITSNWPLCTEYMGFAPNVENDMLAVAIVDSGIELWPVINSEGSYRPDYIFELKNQSKKSSVIALKKNIYTNYILSSATDDGNVQLWDFNNMCSFFHSKQKASTCFSMDWDPFHYNCFVTVNSSNRCYFYDTREFTFKRCKKLRNMSKTRSVLYNPHSENEIIFGCVDGIVNICDRRFVASPVLSYKAHTAEITAMDLCKNTKGLLATCSFDRYIKLWDISAANTGTSTTTNDPPSSSTHLDPTSNLENHTNQQYKFIRSERISKDPVFDIKFSPDCPAVLAYGTKPGKVFILNGMVDENSDKELN